MNSFKIIGGQKLGGDIQPQGAKNEALQVLCAVLLTKDKVTISNIPNIIDVNLLIEIIGDLGVKITKLQEGTFTFQADNVTIEHLQTEDFIKKASRLRGSIMIIGPLLARFKKAMIPKPGGDKIGRRRLDTHFLGFMELGADFVYDDNNQFYTVDASHLTGKYILLDEASVTGTANILMAAVLAKGETTLFNAACEPYIQQLCKMLNAMGADITGIGSNLLKIKGVEELHGCEHRLLADMIEIGSFIGLAALTQSTIKIKNADVAHLGNITTVFKKLGIAMEIENDDITVYGQEKYKIQTFIDGSILTVSDAPWPGFTPDLLSIVLVTSLQADGEVLIHQKMFESRLFFVDKLMDMGAKITLCDPHRAVVIGIKREYNLRGVSMTSPDIRAGQALLIAALSAEGNSTIFNIDQIDRGYQYIDERLRKLGASIIRVEE